MPLIAISTCKSAKLDRFSETPSTSLPTIKQTGKSNFISYIDFDLTVCSNNINFIPKL